MRETALFKHVRGKKTGKGSKRRCPHREYQRRKGRGVLALGKRTNLMRKHEEGITDEEEESRTSG